MNVSTVALILLAVYFVLNFLCALALHIHAEHQAHLRHRALDVLVHFVVLTIFALPALAVVLYEALFGAERPTAMGPSSIQASTARAA